MKHAIAVILIACFSTAISQDLNCEKYKDGKFELIDHETGNSIIERKGNTQIEYGEGSELKMVFKVKWLDECTYTLRLKRILENPHDIMLTEDMILTVQIIEVKENSYVQRSSSNKYDLVLENEMVAID